MIEKTVYGIQFTVNPNDHYPDDTRVMAAVGTLPGWMCGPCTAGGFIQESDPATPMWKNLEDNYQFFGSWHILGGAKVESDLFLYPGDPPLHPLLKAVKGDETIYIYPNAVVAVCYGGVLDKWSRFD